MLSPYLSPQNLNGSFQSSSKVGEWLYGTDDYKALDKRNTSNVRSIVSGVIDSVKDISDSLENITGARAPIYKIGEIDSWDDSPSSAYAPSAVKGLFRAVTTLFDKGGRQEGVIIDGIGDADGTISMAFTKNPVLLRANEVIDNRYREPTVLKMTIMVSNYLNDDITGTLADSLAGLDPTGLTGDLKNMLAHGGNTRAQYALYRLRWLAENGKCFNVYTPHGIYENMLIKSIHPQTNANTMDMLYCDIEFREMIMYSPYSEGVGSMPARASVDSLREGWTNSAVKKVKNFYGLATAE